MRAVAAWLRPSSPEPAARLAGGIRGALRFGIIWFTACALIFQTTLTFGSTIARANDGDAATLSVICHSLGQQLVNQQGGGDNYDQVAAGHLKCIACVIGHTLAPPPATPALAVTFAAVRYTYTLPPAARVSRDAAHHSRFARGPPTAA